MKQVSLFLMFLLVFISTAFSNDYVQRAFFTHKEIQRDHYLSKIQPILDKRCVVCHSCFEAPCQLKLTSYEMLNRGANKNLTSGGLLFAAPRTDIAYTKADQKKDGFFSVIQGGTNSLLLNVLAQGQSDTPLPKEKHKQPQDRACIDNPNAFEHLSDKSKRSLAMPYYMSPLSPEEHETLVNWVAAGSPPPSEEAMEILRTPRNTTAVKEWEDFFNTPTWKGRWTSRYLYEHLFTAHLYIEESPGDYYQLVRSYTPAPQKIRIIPTKRPFVMEPGYENNFYYRLQKVTSTILQKQNFVYRVNPKVMQDLKEMFWNPSWEGSEKVFPFSFKEANPFVAFKHIPAISRYRWMLKNARMLLDMDMRSDNCHGQGATGPLRDDFLNLFVKPESDVTVNVPGYFDQVNPFLRMANTEGKSALEIGLGNAQMNAQFSKNQERYGRVKVAHQKEFLKEGLHFNDLWDGERWTYPPMFTILRHETTVTVHNGVWGPIPRITLLWDYVSFERLYYNCVALTTLFDTINDKLGTVLYLRKVGREIEEQFLSLVPEESRLEIRKDWVRGAGAEKDYKSDIFALPYNKMLSQIKNYQFNSNKPYESMMMYLLLRSGRFDKKSVGQNFYPISQDTPEYAALKETTLQMGQEQSLGEGNRATHFPNVSYIAVKTSSGQMRYYTMIVNRFFEYVNIIKISLGKLESGRVPKLDTLIVFPHVVANYPGKLYLVDEDKFEDFLSDMKSVNSREEYVRFDKTYGLQKMSPNFWPIIDQVQEHFIKQDIIGHGQLDLVEYGQHDLVGSK